MKNLIKTVNDFYPEYLKQHSRPWTRRIHFLGQLATLALIIFAFYMAIMNSPWFLGLLILAQPLTYLFAWNSHFFIEKNRPATFYTPWYVTKLCDVRMAWDMLTAKLPS